MDEGFRKSLPDRSNLNNLFQKVPLSPNNNDTAHMRRLEVRQHSTEACTILVHKKGDKNDPANFRPITPQSVPLKIFTSCLRDSIFSFLSQNHLMEQKIQKGFAHGVSGILKHTSMMSFLINEARIKQRSATITLVSDPKLCANFKFFDAI